MADFENSAFSFEYNPLAYNPRAASIILPLVFDNLNNPNSVLDVGCGLGTWLSVVKQLGINDFLGVEGHEVSQDELFISNEKVLVYDLRMPLELGRVFDLVISLEVAEHLPESSAEIFVSSLVNHGKTILFSAAIPGQGGQNHLNEQWPSYWMKLFSNHGYIFYDTLRPKIWDDNRIEYWYRQNIFLVMHQSIPVQWVPFDGLSKVHPYQWQDTLRWMNYDLDMLEKEKQELENKSSKLLSQLKEWEKGEKPIKAYLLNAINAIKRKKFL